MTDEITAVTQAVMLIGTGILIGLLIAVWQVHKVLKQLRDANKWASSLTPMTDDDHWRTRRVN